MSAILLIIVIIRIIMGMAAMIVNLFTLVCVVTKSYLRTSASLLIAILALSDFLHGVVNSMIYPIRALSTSWHFTHPACLASICIEGIVIIGQFFIFTMLAFERRNSLLSQLNRSTKWNRKTLVVILALVWTIIVSYHIAVTIYTADIPEGTRCTIVRYFPAFFIYIGISIFITATILLIVGYGHIAWIAYKSRNQVNTTQSIMQRRKRKKDMSVTKMMALVVGVFFILYLPFAVTLATLSSTSPLWQVYLYAVTILIYDINFCINPFIYAWRDKGFKRAMGEMASACRRKCCCFLPLPARIASTNTTTMPQVAVIQVSPALGAGLTTGNVQPLLVPREPYANIN